MFLNKIFYDDKTITGWQKLTEIASLRNSTTLIFVSIFLYNKTTVAMVTDSRGNQYWKTV